MDDTCKRQEQHPTRPQLTYGSSARASCLSVPGPFRPLLGGRRCARCVRIAERSQGRSGRGLGLSLIWRRETGDKSSGEIKSNHRGECDTSKNKSNKAKVAKIMTTTTTTWTNHQDVNIHQKREHRRYCTYPERELLKRKPQGACPAGTAH